MGLRLHSWCGESPLSSRFWTLTLWICPNPYIIRTKRKGERGSPFLMPIEGWKVLEGVPLTRMEKKVVETKVKIQFTKWLQKPKSNSIYFKNFQLSLSKALERSSLNSMPSFLVVLS